MSEKVKQYLLVVLLAAAVFGSPLTCADEAGGVGRKVGGCRDIACRDACMGNTHCEIECCKAK